MYTQLNTGSKQRLETEEDSSTEWKAWQVSSFIQVYKVQLSKTEDRCTDLNNVNLTMPDNNNNVLFLNVLFLIIMCVFLMCYFS